MNGVGVLVGDGHFEVEPRVFLAELWLDGSGTVDVRVVHSLIKELHKQEYNAIIALCDIFDFSTEQWNRRVNLLTDRPSKTANNHNSSFRCTFQ